MNNDWQIKAHSRKSSVSGEVFETGSKIICYIYHSEHGEEELVRTDIREEELGTFEVPKNLLARWTQVVKDRKNNEGQKQTLGNIEELFLSLYEEIDEVDKKKNSKKGEILKQLLGLILERKRILKRLKIKDKRIITYLHIATKKEYEVNELDLDLEEIAKMQEQLEILIY